MLRRRAVLLSLAGLLAAPSAIAQQSAPDYRAAFAKSAKKTVQMTLGDFCHPNAEGTGECKDDSKYPLAGVGVLKVKQGAVVEILTRATVSRLGWRAARIDGRGEEQIVAQGTGKAVTKTHRRWRITLPKNLRRSAKVLGLDVNYPYAYSSFEVGLKVAAR